MWFQQYIVLLRPSPWKHLPLWKQWTECAFQKWGESEVKVWVAQLCPTLCNPMDGGPLGSSVHGIFQARILEWVAIPFSTGSSWPRDRTWVFCMAGRLFTIWTIREARIIPFMFRHHVPCRDYEQVPRYCRLPLEVKTASIAEDRCCLSTS